MVPRRSVSDDAAVLRCDRDAAFDAGDACARTARDFEAASRWERRLRSGVFGPPEADVHAAGTGREIATPSGVRLTASCAIDECEPKTARAHR